MHKEEQSSNWLQRMAFRIAEQNRPPSGYLAADAGLSSWFRRIGNSTPARLHS
jgi:hypothetical protein